MIQHEDAFIDRAFELGTVEGLRPDEVKKYMRYMADIRLTQLKLQPIYKISTNPLPWMDEMLNAVEHTNFLKIEQQNIQRQQLQVPGKRHLLNIIYNKLF